MLRRQCLMVKYYVVRGDTYDHTENGLYLPKLSRGDIILVGSLPSGGGCWLRAACTLRHEDTKEHRALVRTRTNGSSDTSGLASISGVISDALLTISTVNKMIR